MKSERKIIDKIVDMAQELGRRDVYIKLEEQKPILDNEASIKARESKIEDMKRALEKLRFSLNNLIEIFED